MTPGTIIAIDLETSGANNLYDQILQVACVRMRGEEVVGTPFSMRVKPLARFKISLEALEAQVGDLDGDSIKNWWEALQEDGVESKTAMSELIAWAEEHEAAKYPNVAHNASFDWSFIHKWEFTYRVMCGNKSPLSPRWICTLAMAQQHPHFEGAKKFGLDVVCQGLGLPPRPKAHDALQDALLAGRVYHRLRTGEGF
jgi:DNA polymerase III epsilon subunit-like protein